MSNFDYSAPAELFPSRNRKVRSPVKYRRFPKAAEAIKFAMEELPEPLLLGAVIVVDEARLDHRGIRDLYESADYPLKKRAA
jgi:hypothetical protein